SPRILRSQKLRRRREYLLAQLAETAVPEKHAGKYRSDRTENTVSLGPLLTACRMACCDMANLMAKHPGEFGLVIHQRNQLARDVDISAWHGEGIVYRTVEQRDVESGLGIRKSGLDGDVLANLLDIGSLRAGHRSPEFVQELLMILGALLRFGGRYRRAGRLCGRRLPHARTTR